MIIAAGAGYAADPGLLELERTRLQREQRIDEIRLQLDQERRTQELQQYYDRRSDLQPAPPPGQLRLQSSPDDQQRRAQLEQLQAQERLSQQLLHQNQLHEQRRSRQRSLFEPGAAAHGEVNLERRRHAREREAQMRQFGVR